MHRFLTRHQFSTPFAASPPNFFTAQVEKFSLKTPFICNAPQCYSLFYHPKRAPIASACSISPSLMPGWPDPIS